MTTKTKTSDDRPFHKVGDMTIHLLSDNGEQFYSIVDRNGNFYAKTYSFTDARLIAAAPELLEALKNIENDDGRIPPTIWKMRNDAISKAEGGK